MPRLPLCSALLSALLLIAPLRADVVYDDLMHALGKYEQDFDDLPTKNENSHFNGDLNKQTFIFGVPEFDGTRIGGNSNIGANLTANTGDFARAGMYSVGNVDLGADGEVPHPDRALGALAGGDRTMAFGFSLLNQYAEGEITSITLDVAPSTAAS